MRVRGVLRKAMKVLGDFHGDVFAVEGFEALDQIFGVVDFCVGPNLLAERDARELKGSAEDAATNHNLHAGMGPNCVDRIDDRTHVGCVCWLAPKINSTSGR